MKTRSLTVPLMAAALALGAPFATVHADGIGDAERGASVFARSCASCHGAQGKGNGPAARALRPAPTDFTAQRIPSERAYQVTKQGGLAHGLAPTMPGFERSLSEQELRDIVAHVVSLYDTTGGAR